MSPTHPEGKALAATHDDNVEGPFAAEREPMDVQYKGELVVTVCAIVYTSGGGVQSRIEFISGAPCQGTVSARCIPTPAHTGAMCLAYLLLTNNLKKNSGGKMLWGVMS